MMKNAILIFVTFYLFMAFGTLEIDFREWTFGQRGFLIFCTTFVTFITAIHKDL